MKKDLKILIIEPSEIITQGLVSILKGQNFNICGIEKNTTRLKSLLEEKKPDVLIVNPTLSAPDNRSSLHLFLVKQPSITIFALIYQYIPNSILKNYSRSIDIHDSAEQIKSYFDELGNKSEENINENYELTTREKDVLTLLVKGLLNKEIADKLNISIHTVITHRKNIVRKTGIKTVAGLTIYAMLNNLME